MLNSCLKLIAGLFLVCVFFTPAQAEEFRLARLEIVKQNGEKAQFEVEIADTAGLRQLGLMYRASLDWNCGMFMDFETDQVMNLWMKNTLLPLDMLFADADGVIFLVVEGAEPNSLEIISSVRPGRYVLEVLAGSARRFGIKPGDVMTLL